MQILSCMCKTEIDTTTAPLRTWRTAQLNHCIRVTPNPQQWTGAKSASWGREGRLSQQTETCSLSHWYLVALGLPSSTQLDLFTSIQRFVEGFSFSPMFVLWFTLGLLEAPVPAFVPKCDWYWLWGRSCNELRGARTHAACPSNTLSLWRPEGVLGGELLSPEHSDRNCPHPLKLLSLWLLPGLTSSILCSGSHVATHHSSKRRCQTRTSSPGENLMHTGMTTIEEKTTVASRCLPTNKDGMKSERNPTFLLAWLSKKKHRERIN